MDEPKQVAKYPKGIPYIIGNEAAERFSFYGIRAIMSVFLVQKFFNPAAQASLQTVAEAKANEYAHFFVTVAYFMPLLGAIAADWFFGKYRVILVVSLIYAVGNLVMALSTHNLTLFSAGLFIIAVAAGGIKSCVSANVGDQFDYSNQSLISKVYGWFYVGINTGGILGTALIPIIYTRFGPAAAFGVPGIFMCMATIIFWSGRKKYVRVPPTGIRKENFMAITGFALKAAFMNRHGKTVWQVVGEKYSEKSIDGTKAVYRILTVFAFTPIFWAMWDQNLSEWILQATKLNLHLFGKFSVLPQQVSVVNNVFLISLIPVFTYVLFPFLEKIGIKPTPLRKIGAGLFLTGICFVIIALLQEKVDEGLHPSVWWQILAYLFLSASEILVSVTCLEYAYTHSPASMKSTMSALYLLTISVGNYFTGLVNGSISNHGFFAQFTGAAYYWLFIKILAVIFIIYLLVAKKIPDKKYILEKAPG